MKNFDTARKIKSEEMKGWQNTIENRKYKKAIMRKLRKKERKKMGNVKYVEKLGKIGKHIIGEMMKKSE